MSATTWAAALGKELHWPTVFVVSNCVASVPVLYHFRCRKAERWVIICMMALCNAIAVTEHKGRKPGLSKALVVMEYGNNRAKI